MSEPKACGCRIEIFHGAFIITPCSLECPTYKYVIEESGKKGNPILKVVKK